MQMESTYLPSELMMLHLTYFLFSHKAYTKYLEMFLYFAKLAFYWEMVSLALYKQNHEFDWWFVCCFGFYRKTQLPQVLVIQVPIFFSFNLVIIVVNLLGKLKRFTSSTFLQIPGTVGTLLGQLFYFSSTSLSTNT